MLSFDCRRFRQEFTPGSGDPHRQGCPACDAYATAMERAAAVPKLPMPESLRGQLRGVLPFVRHDAPRLPMPQAPLPDGLKDRLRGIARGRSRLEIPAWARNSRWAVAASYLLTVVSLSLLGDPVALGHRVTETMARTMTRTMSQAMSQTWTRSWEQSVGEMWTEVREERLPRIENALSDRYGAAVGSLTELGSEVREMSSKLSFRDLIDTEVDKEKP